MNDEQRYEMILKLINESMKSKNTYNKNCLNCRYARKVEYEHISECKNPISYLIKIKYNDSEFPTLKEMRSQNGYCGPEALIFEKRHFLDKILFWRQPTQIKSLGVFMITFLSILIFIFLILIIFL